MGEGSLARLPQANVQVLSAAYPFSLGLHSLCKSLLSTVVTVVSDVSSCELCAHCMHSI